MVRHTNEQPRRNPLTRWMERRRLAAITRLALDLRPASNARYHNGNVRLDVTDEFEDSHLATRSMFLRDKVGEMVLFTSVRVEFDESGAPTGKVKGGYFDNGGEEMGEYCRSYSGPGSEDVGALGPMIHGMKTAVRLQRAAPLSSELANENR